MAEINSPFILLTFILFFATYTDIKRHLIPNGLSLGGIVIGLSINIYQSGFDGALFSLAGLAVGFFLLIPFYAMKGMAAGDVKLMAAVGAFLGPSTTFAVVLSTLICGAVLALAYIAIKNGGKQTFQRYGTILRTLKSTHKWIYIKPSDQDVGSLRFPYAGAILIGTFAGTYYINNTLPFYT